MSNQNPEVRKLPKKSVILISLIVSIAIIGFLFIRTSKNMKIEEVLYKLGHQNISSIKVINKMGVEDKDTRVKSTVYKVAFYDNSLKKECVGFIHRSNNGKYSKDIDCK